MARAVEIEFGTGYAGNKVNGDVSLLSMDFVALAYARKVCLDLGGEYSGRRRDERHVAIPDWAKTPWRDHGVITRLRIRLGLKFP